MATLSHRPLPRAACCCVVRCRCSPSEQRPPYNLVTCRVITCHLHLICVVVHTSLNDISWAFGLRTGAAQPRARSCAARRRWLHDQPSIVVTLVRHRHHTATACLCLLCAAATAATTSSTATNPVAATKYGGQLTCWATRDNGGISTSTTRRAAASCCGAGAAANSTCQPLAPRRQRRVLRRLARASGGRVCANHCNSRRWRRCWRRRRRCRRGSGGRRCWCRCRRSCRRRRVCTRRQAAAGCGCRRRCRYWRWCWSRTGAGWRRWPCHTVAAAT